MAARQASGPSPVLDDVEAHRGGLLVAKIDVEGYEAEEIKGMEGPLKGNKCLLRVEVFPQGLKPFVQRMAELGFLRFAEAATVAISATIGDACTRWFRGCARGPCSWTCQITTRQQPPDLTPRLP